MSEKLISIIIPVYNVEKYLKKCVDSVVNQTYSNLQIILVDDGSKDTSPQICDEYANDDKRIEVIHQENKGLPGARNAGLKIAKGDYVAFIDSDDWVEPQMIEHLLYQAEENKADMSGIEMIETNSEDAKVTQPVCKTEVYSQEDFAKKFFKIGSQKIVHYVCNKLIKRELVADNNFEERFTIGEDVVAFYKIMLKADKIVLSNQRMYYYRQNSGMTSKFNEKYFGLVDVWKRVREISEDNNVTQYMKYVTINQARINFTILTELALSGCSKDKKYESKVCQLLTELKKNKKLLMKSGVALSRKVLINICCFNYNLYAKMAKCLYSIKKDKSV